MGSGSLASSRRSAHARNSIIPCRQVPAGGSARPIANPAPGPTFVTPGPSLVCYAPENVVHATARQVPETMPAIGIARVNTAAPTQEHTSSGCQLTAVPTGVYGQLTYVSTMKCFLPPCCVANYFCRTSFVIDFSYPRITCPFFPRYFSTLTSLPIRHLTMLNNIFHHGFTSLKYSCIMSLLYYCHKFLPSIYHGVKTSFECNMQ